MDGRGVTGARKGRALTERLVMPGWNGPAGAHERDYCKQAYARDPVEPSVRRFERTVRFPVGRHR